MYGITTKQSVSEIRKCAKKVGLTFREANSTLNGGRLYELAVRGAYEIVISNYTLSSAYEDMCSGYIESWNGVKFVGVNNYTSEKGE